MLPRFLRVAICCLLLVPAAQAQTRPEAVRTQLPLRRVTVALNQAELEHQGTVALPAGRSTVWVQNTAHSFDASSLQVTTSDNAELISVDVTASSAGNNTTVADSVQLFNKQILRVGAETKALEEEKTFLLANRVISTGLQTNWSAELQKGATYLRARLADIQTETEALTAKKEQLESARRRINNRTSNSAANQRRIELVLNLARAATVKLTLRYIDSGSFWESTPEIRVPESARELRVRTKASVDNRSGIAWNNVQLQLRNEEVEDDVTRPDLDPWTMNYRRSRGYEGRIDKFVVKGNAGTTAAVAAEQSSVYQLPEPVSIPAADTYQLMLPEQTLPARPEYLTIPKLSGKVFIQAKVSGWDKLYLPDDPDGLDADVFFGDTYVGNTTIEPRAFNDSLEISLGYDNLIVVGRTKTQDFSGKAGLGGQKRIRLTYEINLRNRHTQPVRVRVLDQIPVSQEGDLKVKLEESSVVTHDETSGKLTWLVNLAGGASQRLRFTFTVEYPKDKEVDFQRPRVVRNPKFR